MSTQHTPGPWKQGVNENSRHWVHVPGLVKGINAGSAERAELIVRAVNNHESLLSALQGLVDALYPAWTTSMDTARTAIAKATGSQE